MLLERAAALAEKISRYQKLKAAANEAEIFRTRASQVGQAAALLAQARAALERFKAAGIPVNFVASNADGVLSKASTLKDLVAVDPAALAEPPFNLKYEVTDRLLGIATAANNAIAEAWRTYVASCSASGSEELLDALVRLPQFRSSVTRIRQCRQRITALAAPPPADPAGAVEQLKALVTEHRAAWAELTADGIPDTVIHFIRSCAAEGAPLLELTDEIRTWLETRGLVGAFRIRIG